ncbi:E2 [Zalophus californianus papillomavirus 1]|uniref:Regulatory protein E2 n=1 Tax=Zalophus californianus papillomavirus 1 TaxID=998829 RepID=F2X1C5_9PAPI|nr:E2 [Zalophus californianus papillomavirus 1]ADZ74263.1 E2 [Zalophus californianus papillomavirus 1]
MRQTMEELGTRLDAVQEALMNLYETGGNDLGSQVKHWQLNRQECAILHCARKAGATRLGLQAVPAADISREKAYQAIEMHLLLLSLQDSQYAEEPWTLQETSWERYTTEPRGCLKKGGQTVEVRFDGDTENCTSHVLWDWIYYKDSTETWCKAPGEVDAYGLYYMDAGRKRYYVQFAADARRYSISGLWEVEYGNELFSPLDPVTSSTPAANCRGKASGTPGRAATDGPPIPPRRVGTATHHTPPGALYLRPGAAPAPSAAPPAEAAEAHVEGAEAGPERHPEAGGEGRVDAQNRHPRGPGQLLRQARDSPPAIAILRGPCNTLKCCRYRWKRNHRHLFRAISTTWYWTGEEGSQRNGPARLLLWFDNSAQRSAFLARVPLPALVTAHEGLEGL